MDAAARGSLKGRSKPRPISAQGSPQELVEGSGVGAYYLGVSVAHLDHDAGSDAAGLVPES